MENTIINRVKAVTAQRIKLATQDVQNGADFRTIIYKIIDDNRGLTLEQRNAEYEQIQQAVRISTERINDFKKNGRERLQTSIAAMPDEDKLLAIRAIRSQIIEILKQNRGRTNAISPEAEAALDFIENTDFDAPDEATSNQLTEILLQCHETLGLCNAAQVIESAAYQLDEQEDEYIFTVDETECMQQRELALAVLLSLKRGNKLPWDFASANLQTVSDMACLEEELGTMCAQAASIRDPELLKKGLISIGIAIGLIMFCVLTKLEFDLGVILGEGATFSLLGIEESLIGVNPIIRTLLLDKGYYFSNALVMFSIVASLFAGMNMLKQYFFPAGIFESRLGVKIKDFGAHLRNQARAFFGIAANNTAELGERNAEQNAKANTSAWYENARTDEAADAPLTT